MDVSEHRFVNEGIAALVQNEQAASARTPVPIVFVHGYLDNANSFLPMLPFFKGQHCIAIDQAGHGKSAHRSADAHYHLSDYVYDLYCMVKECPGDQVVLVGHSLGGIVSAMFTACFPERVKRLVLIESLGPLTENENTTTSQLRESILSRVSADKAIKPPGSLERLVKARMQVSDMTPANAELIMRRNTRIDEDKLQWRTDKRLRTKSPMRLTQNQAKDILENIQCPVFLVLGTKGFEKINKMQKDRVSLIDDFSKTTVEGGHHVHMDSPEQVAKAILRFLRLE